MSTAVFLGAGASKAFGYPLSSELLPRLMQRMESGELFDSANPAKQNDRDRAWFAEKLFSFLPGLRDRWREAVAKKEPAGDLGVSITDLLTLVDRAIAHGEARGSMTPEDVPRFRKLVERGIYEALVRNTETRSAAAKKNAGHFSTWLHNQPQFAVLTTNYDLSVERRLFSTVARSDDNIIPDGVGSAVDFGFAWRDVDSGKLIARPSKPVCHLLKLHGSINWLRCALCGQIYLNLHGAVLAKAFADKLDEWNTCHCNDWSHLRTHLVTPSLVRQIQDAHLLGIWQAALEVLRTADRWVIIGYSLPSEDVAIRALFLRAWDGAQKKPEIVVVQRKNEATERTYRAFFPQASLDYRRDGLEKFLATETK